MTHGGRRPGAGRPPSDDPRTIRVVVAFTESERAELEDVRHGVPFAELVRVLALRAARSET